MMPMGNGKLFLPVNAQIRKKIGKKEGDVVHVVLFPDEEPLDVPEEMLLCLQTNRKRSNSFVLSESEQMHYIKWIYAARREATKIDLLAKAVTRLMRGLKLHDKEYKHRRLGEHEC